MKKHWNLVADIGGTNARFAVDDDSSPGLEHIQLFSVSQHPSFLDALKHFLQRVAAQDQWLPLPDQACFAVAGPVDQSEYRFTNSNWHFSKRALQIELPGSQIEVINDFTAIAMTIPTLHHEHWLQIGGGEAQVNAPISLLGPGTGLGVSTLLPCAERWKVIDGEGGHIDFAPVNAVQIELLKILSQQFERVSVERLLSGAGIENIYLALSQMRGQPADLHGAPAITDAAVHHRDTLACESLQIFCDILGATAGNLALMVGARGGVYIAGGIVPRFLDFVSASGIRDRFEAKGRFRQYLSSIPLRVMLNEQPGLHGAAQWLRQASS